MILLDKIYDDESLCDLDRDIHECFDPDFNLAAALLPPPDEYGFRRGSYKVLVYWTSEESD